MQGVCLGGDRIRKRGNEMGVRKTPIKDDLLSRLQIYAGDWTAVLLRNSEKYFVPPSFPTQEL